MATLTELINHMKCLTLCVQGYWLRCPVSLQSKSVLWSPDTLAMRCNTLYSIISRVPFVKPQPFSIAGSALCIRPEIEQACRFSPNQNIILLIHPVCQQVSSILGGIHRGRRELRSIAGLHIAAHCPEAVHNVLAFHGLPHLQHEHMIQIPLTLAILHFISVMLVQCVSSCWNTLEASSALANFQQLKKGFPASIQL